MESPNLIVGMETMDDAGVYRLTDELALVQSVDFFFPIVNDPRSFGRIGAANSLSDIWAMGARAITAMNHLAYPAGKIPPEVIEELLIGAVEKLKEANVVLLGGHTLEQEELVFGMSVTGLTSPETALTNANARIGDLLIITKPLGTGVYCDAMINDGLTKEQFTLYINSMERLNLYASEVIQRFDVSCVTDVTGFGLLGHSLPIAKNANVTVVISSKEVPLLPGLPDMLDMFNPKGVCKCKEWVKPHLEVAPRVDDRYFQLFAEAQTSGGLLATVRPDQADTLVKTLREHGDTESAIIGRIEPNNDGIFLKLT